MVALLDSLVPLKISISTGTEQMVQHPSVPSKSLLAQERSRQDLWLSQQENMTYEQLSALGWSLWILSNMVPKLCSLWFSLPYWEIFLLFGILGIHSSSPFQVTHKQFCQTHTNPRRDWSLFSKILNLSWFFFKCNAKLWTVTPLNVFPFFKMGLITVSTS